METRISDDTTHPTTDNRNSANFVIKEFCELRHNGVLGSSSASVWLQLAQYSQTSSVIWSIIKTAEASSTQSLRRSIELGLPCESACGVGRLRVDDLGSQWVVHHVADQPSV